MPIVNPVSCPDLQPGEPSAVLKQKTDLIRMLDQQIEANLSAIETRTKTECEMTRQQAEAAKKQYIMRADIEMRKQEGLLLQKAEEEKMEVRNKIAQSKAALEQEALTLTMEYEKKKAAELMEKTTEEMTARAEAMQEAHEQDMDGHLKKHGSILRRQMTTQIVSAPSGIAAPVIRGPNLDALLNITQVAGGLNADRMPRFGMPAKMPCLSGSISSMRLQSQQFKNAK